MLHENLSFVCFFGFPVYLYYYSTVVTIRKVFFYSHTALTSFSTARFPIVPLPYTKSESSGFLPPAQSSAVPVCRNRHTESRKKASQHNCAKRYGTTFTCAQDFSTDETGKRIPCRNSHPDQFHRQSHGIGNPAP